jgi:general secretion pathway protein G
MLLMLGGAMNYSIRSKKSGFTLLELIIVISVLALLVTIVIGRYRSLSKDAKYVQVGSNLVMIKSAIARYYAQNDRYPTLAELQALSRSSSLESSTDEVSVIGDYIEGIPKTPRFRSTSDEVDHEATNEVSSAFSGDGGWVYDENTGVVYPDLPATEFGADDWQRQNSNF